MCGQVLLRLYAAPNFNGLAIVCKKQLQICHMGTVFQVILQ